MKRFLNKFELEIEYGFKLDWQAKARQHKTIPFIKIGSIVKYDRIEIEKWLEAHAIVSFESA
jgi:hypothetical protein